MMFDLAVQIKQNGIGLFAVMFFDCNCFIANQGNIMCAMILWQASGCHGPPNWVASTSSRC